MLRCRTNSIRNSPSENQNGNLINKSSPTRLKIQHGCQSKILIMSGGTIPTVFLNASQLRKCKNDEKDNDNCKRADYKKHLSAGKVLGFCSELCAVLLVQVK